MTTRAVVRRYAVGTLAGALRGVAAPAGAADEAGRVTPVARPHGAAAGDGGAAAKGARR